ncbi:MULTISPECIES: serine/threonine-protein kinase [unclassified Frankia]|uniref:serine/threonine-protein kinase n=1 Tax=unclassified Frankia TaxID=2632575 RepID=UPI0020257B62
MIVDRARIGAALPAYELGTQLGTGAFGLVIEGRHRRLERPVAIKVLAAAQEGAGTDFAAEARLLAGIDHPHVVRVYDYVETVDLHLIIMELLGGGTLTRRRVGLPPEDACAAGLAVATALSCAHGQGMLHRDIKTDNMLFDTTGLLKVTDFGIAKIVEGTAATASALVGTPAYMAPEQITGGRLGPATDLYALGVVLYHLLTGAAPFDPKLPVRALWQQHLDVVPASPTGVPAPVAEVVLRALAKDPAARQPSAHAFALELAHAAADAYGPGWTTRSSIRLRLDDDIRQAAGHVPAPGERVPPTARYVPTAPPPPADAFRPAGPPPPAGAFRPAAAPPPAGASDKADAFRPATPPPAADVLNKQETPAYQARGHEPRLRAGRGADTGADSTGIGAGYGAQGTQPPWPHQAQPPLPGTLPFQPPAVPPGDGDRGRRPRRRLRWAVVTAFLLAAVIAAVVSLATLTGTGDGEASLASAGAAGSRGPIVSPSSPGSSASSSSRGSSDSSASSASSPLPVSSVSGDAVSGAAGGASPSALSGTRPWSEATAVLTATDGVATSVRAETLSYCISVGHGITLSSGQDIPFEKMRSIEVLRSDEQFTPNGKADLVVTLLTGQTARGGIGTGCDFFGTNDLGRFSIYPNRLKRIDFQR